MHVCARAARLSHDTEELMSRKCEAEEGERLISLATSSTHCFVFTQHIVIK